MTAPTTAPATTAEAQAPAPTATTSRVQLALGSSGVPETFVVDGRGIVVKQIIGDIREDNIGEIVQAVREAR